MFHLESLGILEPEEWGFPTAPDNPLLHRLSVRFWLYRSIEQSNRCLYAEVRTKKVTAWMPIAGFGLDRTTDNITVSEK